MAELTAQDLAEFEAFRKARAAAADAPPPEPDPYAGDVFANLVRKARLASEREEQAAIRSLSAFCEDVDDRTDARHELEARVEELEKAVKVLQEKQDNPPKSPQVTAKDEG